MILRATLLLTLFATATAAASGCASFRRIYDSTSNIDEKQAERAAEALAIFESQRNFAQFQAAQARWREGNMSACLDDLEAILLRDPNHLDSRMLLVQVHLAEENYDLARGYLDQLLAEHPSDARAQHAMGLVLEAQGLSAEAEAYYRRAADLEPENEQYSLHCAARPAPASSADPPPAGAKIDVAPVSHAETPGGDESVVIIRPDVETALAAAEAALERGDTRRARDLLAKAVSLDPDLPQSPIRAAVLALRHRQPQLALFVLQPLEKRFPDSPAFWRTLGAAYYRQADYQQAQSALQQALSLDNSNALAYLLMGCTLEKLGQSEAAATHLSQARRLDPRLEQKP